MDPATQQLNDNLAEGIRQHAETRQFLRDEGDGIAQAKADMVESAEAKEAELEGHFDNFLSNARKELPFYRILPNQRLLNITDDGLIEGWSGHSISAPIEIIETVHSGALPETRHDEAKALLIEMTGSNQQNVSHSFNILKITLTKSPDSAFAHAPGIHYPLNNYITDGAWVKILTGDIRSGWATGASLDGWKLCGRNVAPMPGTIYTGNHPKIYSDICEVLIALPTTVMGRFDLSSKSWGIFPLIHGGNGVGE